MNELKCDSRDIIKSICRDQQLREEVIKMVDDPSQVERLPRSITASQRESLSAGNRQNLRDRANDVFDGASNDMAMEAIIRWVGRPVVRIQHDDLLDNDIPTNTLRARLNPHRVAIRSVIKSVGRIEVRGHAQLPWVGTGWVVDDDIIATNRHVAAEFAGLVGRQFRFLPGVFGNAMTARIDFLQEHGRSEALEFELASVLHIEPAGGPDIAFLKVNWGDSGQQRNVLSLWTSAIELDRDIAVYGYPARDTRTHRPNAMDDIFNGIYNVKRFAHGKVLDLSSQRGLLTHDCTTLGGNSGSAVVDLGTGKVIGLHFAGKEEQANYAVTADVIKLRLKEVTARLATVSVQLESSFNEVREEIPQSSSLDDRLGYDPKFLGITVNVPVPNDLSTLAPVMGRSDGELKYTHYSAYMNAERRVAMVTAVNIDGNTLFRIPRGNDKWYFDPRLDLSHQVGNELYKNNPLDRGHLVRRLDPCWGQNRAEAAQGIEDSFFYTNSAPQHLSLNRRTWLGLEDYILNNARAHDLKVTVFSGPVFNEDDEEYRGIKIPNEYWKVIVITVPENEERAGQLSATGYLLSQKSLVEDLEFVYGEHKEFQVPIKKIELLTQLDFGGLSEIDPMQIMNQEAIMPGRAIYRYQDIVL